jgi:hypothetical protein
MKNCEEAVREINGGRSMLLALLKLSSEELFGAAESLECPYCREHMRLEAGEVHRVLSRIESDDNRRHDHGIAERLEMLGTSIKIIANVLLGGLRRAGVI